MQVLIINGSPRKNGVTAEVLHRIEENLRKAGIDVLFYNLGEIKMSHCIGCNYCYRTGHCCIEDDAELLSKRIEEADGIVLGSPTYASNVSGLMKDFIDRGHFVIEQLLHKKYCIAVASGGKLRKSRYFESSKESCVIFRREIERKAPNSVLL